MNFPTVTPEESPSQADEGSIRFQPFDESGRFSFTPGGHELRRSAVRGAGATTVAQASGLAIQIISTMVLARLLAPADFGLVTMVTTFSLLLMNAGGNGFTEAILQRKDIDRFLASNLFWMNLGTGFVLTMVFAAAGSLMAAFYHNPRVAPVAVGLSLTILITSASVLHLALLMRAMRFPIVYANQIVARLISVVVSIGFARAGWGYWALVAGAVAQPLSECIGAWNLCRWIPSRPRRVGATGAMVRFALHVYGRFSFNYFARNVDNLLIGWRFNAQSLGFYKKAYDLFAMSSVLQTYTNVAVAALSRLTHDAEQYKKHLLSALSVWAFVGMGVGGALTLIGKDLVRVLLGPAWGPAGLVFTFFGPGFGIMFIYGIHGWIHLSIGKPERWFKWAIIEFLVTGLLFVLALRWGPAGVATAWSVSLLILTMPALWYAGKPIRFGLGPMLASVWRFLLAALLAGCGTAIILGERISAAAPVSLAEAILNIVETCLLFGLFYIGTVIILHRNCRPLYQVGGLLREMLSFGKPSKGLAVPGAVGIVQ
jgi:PST family polysaccharide transporter